MSSSRVIVATSFCLALACGACGSERPDYSDVTHVHQPANEGANASQRNLHLRNAFLLGGEPGQPAPGELPLYAVIINDQPQPDRLERIGVEGGGSVRLAAPLDLPPRQPIGTDRPVATVTGVRATGWVPMTFTFKNAGSVRVLVPIKEKAGYLSSLTPAPSAVAS
ncbi:MULTISPECIES: hypothetical protein [Nonomuraea]|uniref:Copper chaperone PCu(A)C n=1 Tax=Nonomuraea mangrovi TaxID=2316207 RepID=A0ABW4SXH1_9ACTN